MRGLIEQQLSRVSHADWTKDVVSGIRMDMIMAFKSLTCFEHSLGITPVALHSDHIHGQAKARILLHVVQGYVH